MLKQHLKKILRICGYNVTSAKQVKIHPEEVRHNKQIPVDIRDKSNDPMQLPYFMGHPVLVDACVSKIGRYFFTPNVDPYIYSVKGALCKDIQMGLLRESLRSYYSMVKPNNACEWLGLTKNEAPLLYQSPSWVSPFPWESLSMEKEYEGMKRIIEFENQLSGKKASVFEGWNGCGPVSEEKLKIETNRLYKVLKSIEANGYRRNDCPDGDIEVVALVREDGHWKLHVRQGQHRFAVLMALGYKTIPVRVISIVYRRDSLIWPNVQSKLYANEAALKVFDRMFYGDAPKVVRPWLDEIKLRVNN